ncbi:hypothetical protein HYDPIDRAFT_173941 [Hydnomerulius pinastri MD-312]|nr:hypothetical protein HYDPIDRAFT_173941 [Hydnomerulius pinastri MD-312]
MDPQAEVKLAPYGTWTSPITSDLVSGSNIIISYVFVDPITQHVYHIERRPAEGDLPILLPTPHPSQQHLLVAISEDHTEDTPSRVVNSLVYIDTLTCTVYPLISGAHFYGAPTFSLDGTKLAWQEWNHPHVPWAGTDIYVANISASPTSILETSRTRIAHSTTPQATRPGSCVSYVSWLTNASLLFLAEDGGWRNPWVYSLSSRDARPVLREPMEEDFASIYKLLGSSYYAPLHFSDSEDGASASDTTESIFVAFVFVAFRGGQSVLYILDVSSLGNVEVIEVDCPFDTADVMFIAPRVDAPSAVIFCSISRSPTWGYTASFSSPGTPETNALAAYISPPRPMTLTLGDGEPLHAVLYAPTNPSFAAPDGEKPPRIVNIHGGPTTVALQSLDWTEQWFTSRGWAWLDVNYRGSSFYDRKYADSLNGNWGVLDVRDCVDAPRILPSPPYALVDPARYVIRGGSAGGYTVLNYAAGSACPSTDFKFKAGASLYGIGDLAALGRESHKFESHYLFGLVGGHPDDPGREGVLQGLADRVVPPAQSQQIVDAIQKNGGSERVRYREYEGEGHGFARADSKKAALEEEAGWFVEVLSIERRFELGGVGSVGCAYLLWNNFGVPGAPVVQTEIGMKSL